MSRAHRTLARAAVFLRLGGLAEIGLAAALDFRRYPSPVLVSVLVAAVLAEGAVFVAGCLRSGRLRGALVGADVLFCTVALVAGSALTAPTDFGTWANFMYPFTIITAFGIGVGCRPLSGALAMTGVLVAGYVGSAILVHRDPVWNVLPNSLTYLVNVIVAWAIAGHLLANGRESDLIRDDAVRRAAELARERERARHARILHDRVLQTLETLAGGRWLSDDGVRARVGAEAAWLRALVEGVDLDEGEPDLEVALRLLVQRHAAVGLRVQLNGARLRHGGRLREALSRNAVMAISDATREALSNVAKHAGVDTAVVRAGATAGAVTVSVVDQGRGFDPAATGRGTGLDRSIRARMAEVGGRVRIDSAPGAGTCVELTVPFAAATIEPPAQRAARHPGGVPR